LTILKGVVARLKGAGPACAVLLRLSPVSVVLPLDRVLISTAVQSTTSEFNGCVKLVNYVERIQTPQDSATELLRCALLMINLWMCRFKETRCWQGNATVMLESAKPRTLVRTGTMCMLCDLLVRNHLS
jgi:hypothetical protein